MERAAVTAPIGTTTLGSPGSAGRTSIDPLAPDVSTNVQAAYEFLMRNEGEIRQVSTLADLDTFAPADGGGQRIISVAVRQTGSITLPIGEYLTFTAAGTWSGNLSPVGQIIGNVAGGLIRGPATMRDTVIVNIGGPDIAVSAPAVTDLVSLQGVRLAGPVAAGTVSNVNGVVEMLRTSFVGGAAGLTVDGTINLVSLDTWFATSPSAPTFIGVDVLGTTTVTGTLRFVNGAAQTFQAAQAGIRISDSATVPPGGIRISGNEHTAFGGLGVLIDQSAGNYTTRELEVIARGNEGTANSVARGDAGFRDLTNFVEVAGGADTWLVIPHTDAARLSPGLVASTSEERFVLVEDSTGNALSAATSGLTDWAYEFIGPSLLSFGVFFRATSRSGGGGTPNVQFRVSMKQPGGGWVGLDDTITTRERTSRWEQAIGFGSTVAVQPGTRFRSETLTLGAATDTEIGEQQLVVEAPL